MNVLLDLIAAAMLALAAVARWLFIGSARIAGAIAREWDRAGR